MHAKRQIQKNFKNSFRFVFHLRPQLSGDGSQKVNRCSPFNVFASVFQGELNDEVFNLCMGLLCWFDSWNLRLPLGWHGDLWLLYSSS